VNSAGVTLSDRRDHVCNRRRFTWLFTLVVACTDGLPPPAQPVVRDSAGVTIVESAGPRWSEGEAWRVAPLPRVDIGVADGSPTQQLFQVRRAARLSDGSIVVANRGSHELRYFDATGVHLTSAGGRGGGPGEFEDLRWMGVMPGDSVVAYDIAHRRLSVFDAHGAFQYSSAVQGPQFFAHGAFADGSVLMFRWEDMEDGAARRTTVAVRYGTDGILRDSLVSLPGPELLIEIEQLSTPRGVLPLWTSRDLVFAHDAVLAVSGMHLYSGTQDRYEIDVRDTTGTLVASVRAAREPVPVTEAEVDAYKAEAMAGYSGEDAAHHRTLMRDTPHAEVFPAHGAILVDADGNLWVEEYRQPGDDRPRWTVFDPAHGMLGTVELPEGLTVFQIGADFVLGKWTDDFGVEHVRLHDLIKPR
jgi:hypothetical protein